MNPRLLDIQAEREEQRRIIAAALERLAALDVESASLFASLRTELPPQELSFSGDGEIDWIVGRSTFSPSTCRLVRELWESPTKFISREEFREFVQFDEDADDAAIRTCVCRARKELSAKGFPYDIETVKSKGYKIVKALPNVTK